MVAARRGRGQRACRRRPALHLDADRVQIRLAYSPDSDDAFMFWALAHHRIKPFDMEFLHRRADTEALNLAAEHDDAADVSAVSVHQYAYLADDWLLLPHGGSMGDGY